MGVGIVSDVFENAYFWEKDAIAPPDGSEDMAQRYVIRNIDETERIVELFKSKLIRNVALDSLFKHVPSRRRIISRIMFSPENRLANGALDEDIDAVLDEFRAQLYPKSKERGRFLVSILHTGRFLMLAHCKKTPSIAEIPKGRGEINVETVKVLLAPQNVIRSVVFEKLDESTIRAYIYEQSRVLSKAISQFTGVRDIRYINWDIAGEIILVLQSTKLGVPIIQVPINTTQVEELIRDGVLINDVSDNTWYFKLGNEILEVDHVKYRDKNNNIWKRTTFKEFYLEYTFGIPFIKQAREEFKRIIYYPYIYAKKKSDSMKIRSSLSSDINTAKYIETWNEIYKIGDEDPIIEKPDIRFKLLFTTDLKPGIVLSRDVIWGIRNTILKYSPKLQVYHIGENMTSPVRETISSSPISIGNLEIYNDIPYTPFLDFVNNLIKKLSDSDSKKSKTILELSLYGILEKWLSDTGFYNLSFLFSQLSNIIYRQELRALFANMGALFKEGESLIDLKSGKGISEVRSPEEIGRIIAEDVVKYIGWDPNTGLPRRLALIYGLDDNYTPSPVLIKNDDVTSIQQIVNEHLAREQFEVKIYPVEVDSGFILIVTMLPAYTLFEQGNITETLAAMFEDR